MLGTQQFDYFEVTNGQFRSKSEGILGEAEYVGCTGALNIETETRTISKRCEGKVTKEVTVVERLTGTFTGHMTVGMLRKVFGLTNEGLKTGVYGYSANSLGGQGSLTWDVYDIGRENKKMIALPNMSWVGGFKLDFENGQDEIAEVELEFSALVDENGFFYYEVFTDDEVEEGVITGWNKTFEPKLVKATEL